MAARIFTIRLNSLICNYWCRHPAKFLRKFLENEGGFWPEPNGQRCGKNWLCRKTVVGEFRGQMKDVKDPSSLRLIKTIDAWEMSGYCSACGGFLKIISSFASNARWRIRHNCHESRPRLAYVTSTEKLLRQARVWLAVYGNAWKAS